MLQGKGVVAKAIVGCKIWFPHGSVGSIPTTRTNTNKSKRYHCWTNAHIGCIATSVAFPTLPRSGSRVRIPSPAPNFFKLINESEGSVRDFFCFPASGVKAGEAGGKQQTAEVSGLSDALPGCSGNSGIMLQLSLADRRTSTANSVLQRQCRYGARGRPAGSNLR
jgi:hypothetical protein